MWILPSINRPEQCKAVIDRIRSIGCNSVGVLLVNGGDPTPYYAIDLPEGWIFRYVKTNLGVCGAMNKILRDYPDELWYGLICDDEFIYTENWDEKLIEAAGEWNIAHGNDGWQSHERIHGYVCLGGKLVRSLGWIALPGLWHWFVDDAWELLARECGLRRFLPCIKVEHRHWMAGKNVKDDINWLGESRATSDQKVFLTWVRNGAAQAIQTIKEKMACSQQN